MDIEVVILPQLLRPEHVEGRAVVVLDVLRATTTMAAALAAGAREIRIFGSIDELRTAAIAGARGAALLCGEAQCLRPEGFDLGNSPLDFTPDRCAGRTIWLSTTNGTRAVERARGAARLYAGALVNAAATARSVAETEMDVTLLCAGTDRELAIEDLIGAGAIIAQLRGLTAIKHQSDAARLADHLFTTCQNDLASALRRSQGGQNLTRAGLAADITFAARVNAMDVVADIHPRALTVVARATV